MKENHFMMKKKSKSSILSIFTCRYNKKRNTYLFSFIDKREGDNSKEIPGQKTLL